MNIKPYAASLGKTDKENAADLAESQAIEIQKDLELRIAKKDQEIKKAELAIERATKSYPLETATVLQQMEDISILQLERSNMVKLSEALFPSAK